MSHIHWQSCDKRPVLCLRDKFGGCSKAIHIAWVR